MATFFDIGCNVSEVTSNRGFTTVTGYFNGVKLSIVAIGMVIE